MCYTIEFHSLNKLHNNGLQNFNVASFCGPQHILLTIDFLSCDPQHVTGDCTFGFHYPLPKYFDVWNKCFVDFIFYIALKEEFQGDNNRSQIYKYMPNRMYGLRSNSRLRRSFTGGPLLATHKTFPRDTNRLFREDWTSASRQITFPVSRHFRYHALTICSDSVNL